MIVQLFLALCRCLQEFNIRRKEKTATSRGMDFGRTTSFASMPATLTHCDKVLKENEETVNRYKFTSGWTRVGVLGQGGFGKVFLFEKEKTKALIARKVVSHRPSERGFRSEEMIHIQMSHPNVLKLFCWEQRAITLCLYLEYCSRGDMMSNIDVLSEKEVKSYFKQLLDGVKYLHSRGVAHRDLKPDNLLVTKDKVLKISDFGLACLFIKNGEETRLSGKVGTRPYMAPEVLQCHEKSYLGPPVDVWACGVIFFNMMTRRKPWAKADPKDKNYRRWAEKNKGIYKKEAWKKLNKTSRTLVSLLLEPDPLKRLSGWRSLCGQ
ncbi:serine/threonine-protein kinase Chk1-like [Oratosquilla oratoria]|uniref:serine/threonine-protein kinase Chk1-like n=1 Tax=Oratosquilla oratoria TaxID=337810 RepID=UPI003F77309D